MRFRKRPVEIEAVQLHGPFLSEIREHFPEVTIQANGTAKIETLEGTMLASEFDWIIRGVKGEVYPCKPDIFEATYEAVQP